MIMPGRSCVAGIAIAGKISLIAAKNRMGREAGQATPSAAAHEDQVIILHVVEALGESGARLVTVQSF